MSTYFGLWPEPKEHTTARKAMEYPRPESTARGGRFRVVVAFAILAAIALVVSDHIVTSAGGGVATPASGTYFVLGLIFGAVSAATAFFGFLFTGRPW
jgi:hypothetical protein